MLLSIMLLFALPASSVEAPGTVPATAQVAASATTRATASATAATPQATPTAPDNDLILSEISSQYSPLYYPALMARYRDGDTTLTAHEFVCLYYGYPFQESYRPLSPAPAATNDLLDRFAANIEPDSAQCAELVSLGERVFDAEPFNLQVINLLTFAYGRLGDKKMERTNYFRLRNVINTITSSGTGLAERSPWHVIYFANAIETLTSMGLHPGRRLVASRTVEYVSLLVRNGPVRGYYFDFGRIYMKKP
jgi:hypothetical protein